MKFFFCDTSLEDWPGAYRLGGTRSLGVRGFVGGVRLSFVLFHVVEISRVRIHDWVPVNNDRIII